jgi:hypothetical protein
MARELNPSAARLLHECSNAERAAEVTMQHSVALRVALTLGACLAFTAASPVRADSPRDLGVADADTIPPHRTWGPTTRVGTVVGTVQTSEVTVSALGVAVALGHRFGRLALESELAAISLEEQGPSSLELGRDVRLGVIARYDAVRVTSRRSFPNTLLAMFIEGGAAQTWKHWFEPEPHERSRLVPLDSRQVEAQLGFGVSIDQRFARAGGSSGRVAWQLGWRIAGLPADHDAPAYACRGTCQLAGAAAPPADEDKLQGSLLFQSSLLFTW